MGNTEYWLGLKAGDVWCGCNRRGDVTCEQCRRSWLFEDSSGRSDADVTTSSWWHHWRNKEPKFYQECGVLAASGWNSELCRAQHQAICKRGKR